MFLFTKVWKKFWLSRTIAHSDDAEENFKTMTGTHMVAEWMDCKATLAVLVIFLYSLDYERDALKSVWCRTVALLDNFAFVVGVVCLPVSSDISAEHSLYEILFEASAEVSSRGDDLNLPGLS